MKTPVVSRRDLVPECRVQVCQSRWVNTGLDRVESTGAANANAQPRGRLQTIEDETLGAPEVLSPVALSNQVDINTLIREPAIHRSTANHGEARTSAWTHPAVPLMHAGEAK